MSIPKKIHFVWIGPPMPAWARMNIEEFRHLNPEHEITVHGLEVLLPQYREMYASLKGIPEPQADLLRYSALQRYGGWYFDADFWPLRPLAGIEEAYHLDGQRLFVTEQHGQKNKSLTMANGVLACDRGIKAWGTIDREIAAMPMRPGRIALGPGLLSRLMGQRPDLFTAGRWPWFYPAAIGDTFPRYHRLVAGERARTVLWDVLHQTVGQLPFVMHMWMHGKTELPAADADAAADNRPPIGLEGLRVGLVVTPGQWIDDKQPFQAVATGFEKLGCYVQVRKVGKWPLFDKPQIVVMWNGRKNLYIQISAGARAAGCARLVMEHGFFDRRAYTQIDHAGILHWASWTSELRAPAPGAGARRLRAVWPDPLGKFNGREGYALVIGQVPGDSQLDESDITKPKRFLRAVAKALPAGTEAEFRPHPRRRTMSSIARWMRMCEADTLAEAVQGAKFAVTINSNAGNECLAMGCPVLALGPALYLKAGVARQGTPATLGDDLKAMAGGWKPDAQEVRNYLQWLACRQWNRHEIAEGTILAKLTERAMR